MLGIMMTVSNLFVLTDISNTDNHS